MADLISYEPATGAVLWRGQSGDVEAEVATARASWVAWASHPLTYRIEAMRRFANVVRGKAEPFADLIARETGKPLWEARTEVEAVVNKVDISVSAYADRTSQRRLEGALGARVAVRHKPHGVLAVLGPYNFPAHLPNGHIVPALIAGNAVVFKPSEKAPATGAMLVDCFHQAGIPEGVVRLLIGGPEQGKALASEPGIDGLLFTGSARAGMSLHRQFGAALKREQRAFGLDACAFPNGERFELARERRTHVDEIAFEITLPACHVWPATTAQNHGSDREARAHRETPTMKEKIFHTPCVPLR